MTDGVPAAYHRARGEQVEERAFNVLQRHLVEQGHTLTRIRRPDRENRATPDVDFLADIDGRQVAIEITQLAQEQEWWNLLDRLQERVRGDLLQGDTDPGWVVLWINLLTTASYRSVDAAGVQIAQAVRGLREITAEQWHHVRLPEPANSLVEVEVKQLSANGSRISFVTGNEANDALIAPRASRFVQRLIETKTAQGAKYAEVWIVVVDAELVIDIDDLREAFALHRKALPENWTRVHLIPASNPDTLESLDLRVVGLA